MVSRIYNFFSFKPLFEFENTSNRNVLFIVSSLNINVTKKANGLLDDMSNIINNRELKNYNITAFKLGNSDNPKLSVFILQSGESYKIRFKTDIICMYALIEDTARKNNWLIAENHIFDREYTKFCFLDCHVSKAQEPALPTELNTIINPICDVALV